MTEELEKGGFEIINSGIKELWNPDEEALNRCREFGKSIAEAI